jgi:ankyrin repeat protein
MEQNELEIAVENNDFVGIQVAIKSCADINIQNTEGNTALHLAISKSCDYDMLKLLLSNGADVTIKNKEGYSPLQLIDPKSHETFLNLFRLEQYINYNGGVGNTIMHLLLMTDTADISLWNTILEEFPTLHIDFNAQNALGHTPLHIAAARIMGIEDLQFILNNFDGLNISLTDKKGNTFLHTFMANIMSVDYHNSFLTSLLQGNFKYCTTADIKMLLCHKNKNGYTPLHLYVNESEEVSVDILNVFVNSGAQMNSDNVFGENILHALVRSFPDNAEAIDYALEHGGNANVKNAFGESPIFFTDSIDVVQVLLKANADLSLRNKVGKTPLMSMILRNQVKFDLIETLIKNGANINEVDNYGNSVLHFAAWNGVDEDIINLLKENGVKSLPDSMGNFPCQVAQKMGHLSLIKNICICENGSDAHLHSLEGVSFSKRNHLLE